MPRKSRGHPASPKKSASIPREYAAQRYRFHRLHDRLSDRQLVRVADIAEELGVAKITIKRDIARMRDEHDAPIAWVAQRRGYVYTGPCKLFPTLRLTQHESLALALNARRFGAAPRSPLARAFKSLLRKLEPVASGDTSFALDVVHDVLFREDETAASEDRFIPLLDEAIARGRELAIVYERPAEQPAPRTIRPLHLAYLGHQWTLFARDVRLPDRDKTYLLARLHAAKPTGETFSGPRDFDDEKLVRGTLRRYVGTGDHEVRIALDVIVAAYAQKPKWHPDQVLTPMPDGRTELKVRLNNLVEIEREVLRCGEHAEVLAPAELPARICDVHRMALARYSDNGAPGK